MPFKPDLENLDDLITKGFNTGDIPEKAAQADLTLARLKTLLNKKSDEIWKTGAVEIDKLNILEKEYEGATTKKVKEALKVKRFFLFIAKWFFRLMLPILLVALASGYIVVALTDGWGQTLTTLLTQSLFIPVSIVLLVLFFVYRAQAEGLEFKEYSFREKVQEGKELTDLKKKVDDARQELDNKVINQGIKPLLKETIDKRLNTPFSISLPKLEYSGLSEVFDSNNEIVTEAKRKLEFMLANMSGGSIGIAGPRGAGKTTLLKSSCKDSLSMPDGPRVISVLTSSPVEYQARDFILHLFSSVCFKALEITTSRKTVHTAWEEIEEIRQPITTPFSHFIVPLSKFCLIIGSMLITLSFVIAGFTMKGKAPSASPQPPAAESNANAVGPNERTPVEEKVAEQANSSAVGRFISALGIKSGPLLMWGTILFLVGFALAYFIMTIERREWHMLRRRREPSYFNPSISIKEREHLEEIYDEAKKWLKEIKFQQSYTSGWSGALKLPIGLEGGVNTAVNLAQQQLSLPDITKGFCDFLNFLTRDFRVIIGIDELDKLESDEAAQRFLNEIKSIFGLENVFYLISVSESALSNFERRGLPFRDVFDSSFDDVIRVDYLNLNSAKRLITRRVIAMPPPFIHLCYCISGGLARDLIRACRNLMALSEKNYLPENGNTSSSDNNLMKLSGSLIKDDLHLKIQAMRVAAKKVKQESEVTWLLDKLHKLEGELESIPSLLQNYNDLIKNLELTKRAEKGNGELQVKDFMELYERLKQDLPSYNQSKPAAEEGQETASLYEEFAVYIYYCATLLQFFDDRLNAAKLSEAENKKAFDLLARARQSLSVNPRATRSMIDECRRIINITDPLVVS